MADGGWGPEWPKETAWEIVWGLGRPWGCCDMEEAGGCLSPWCGGPDCCCCCCCCKV